MISKTFDQHIESVGGIPTDFAGKIEKITVGCRTPEQLDAVRRLFNVVPFTHWVGNPFRLDTPDESYICTFSILYYINDRELRSALISPRGQVKFMSAESIEKWYRLSKSGKVTEIIR